jgi:ribosomal protein S18 acetylase RimI-like enzyme
MKDLTVEYITCDNIEKFNLCGHYDVYNDLLKQLYPECKGDFKSPSLHDGKILCLLFNGNKEVIGLCGFYEMDCANEGMRLHIADLIIDKSYRSQSFGKFLMDKIKDDFTQRNGFEPSLGVECTVDRKKSQSFYTNKCDLQPGKFLYMPATESLAMTY